MSTGGRTSFATARCPIARSLGAVGDPWSLLIVREALRGARRFGEFQTRLGVAKNILAARLRTLAAEGVLQARPGEAGGRHEYGLTAKGEALSVVLLALAEWGGAHAFGPDETPPALVERSTRRPVRGLVVEAADGRLVPVRDVTVDGAGVTAAV